MTKISVELVPRCPEILEQELLDIKNNLPMVDFINIPDLLSCELHSIEAAKIAKKHYAKVVPHLRAMDYDFTQALPFQEELLKANITDILVVEGDPPQTMKQRVYPTISTDIIKQIRDELPHMHIYAGVDQYRSNFQEEEYRIRRKILAGAQGFFTQPFFDMRYLEIYADILHDYDVYWGITPVLSERSVSYWRSKNKAIFPRDFEPTLEWNIEFARKVLSFARENDHNIYIMPIKADVLPYLKAVLLD